MSESRLGRGVPPSAFLFRVGFTRQAGFHHSLDISVRVIDLFTVKPLDAATIISNAKATGGRIITVEDHYPEGVCRSWGLCWKSALVDCVFCFLD